MSRKSANQDQNNAPEPAIRLLLVEDNPGDARLIEEMLRDAATSEFSITKAQTLAAATEHDIRSAFDAILLDMSLPDSHGIQTYLTMREHAEWVPIIVLTGLSDQSVALETVQKGAQDYLVKGCIDGEQLERAVRYARERGAILQELRASRSSLIATKEQLERALNGIKDDLQTARLVQRALLPRVEGLVYGTEVAGVYMPSEAVGGDLYDIVSIDNDRVAMLILDVAGHGVAAALISAMAKASFSRHLDRNLSPAQVFSEVNAELIDYFPHNMYFTAFLAVLNGRNREFAYSSAGHPPVALIRKGASAVESLKTSGPFIGLLPESSYHDASVRLGQGDRVVMYTDGVTESMDPQNRQFGRTRLYEVLMKARDLLPHEMLEAVVEERRAFVAGQGQKDDITLLSFQVL